jgi:multidrug efflux pump subunit AcrB
VMVNIDPTQLYANNVSANDIGNSLATSNVIIPAGTARIGHYEYHVDINMSPNSMSEFNRMPVKIVNGVPVLLGDVAHVTDTHQPPTNIVRVDGNPATYLMVIKHAAASTLAVVDAVKARLPFIRATAPKGIKVALTFDQSKFVRAALFEVVREAGIAAFLVALMVLVFTGSGRSMAIVITSIPLSILTAIVALKLFGQTINTMTLGGIALAVGMLVDDATVEVENIHRNHAMNKPLLVAILDGAHQIATPTLVGTLSICIVFFPVVLLTGVARFLFTPLALAVVFAMLTSYLLSRTLVPTMASHLLPERHEEPDANTHIGRMLIQFEAGVTRIRESYVAAFQSFLEHRAIALVAVTCAIVATIPLIYVVGEDFFPTVDAGMMRMHVRAPTGTRLERSEQIVQAIETSIRKIIPPDELESISDNIGVPLYYDLGFYQTDSVAAQDTDVLIQLRPKHHPTQQYQDKIRRMLAHDYPGVVGYFQAADIVGQVLNFGLPAMIDVQISGNDLNSDYAYAARLQQKLNRIPGLVDIRIAEPLDYPALRVNVDRTKALEVGVTEQEAASSALSTLYGASLLQPNFWLDPKNGVQYNVIAQSPYHMMNSVDAIENIPLTPGQVNNPNGSAQLLSNVASVQHGVDPAVVDHYSVQRVIDVDCAVSGRDLGSATASVERAIASLGQLPAGTLVNVRGQSQAMRDSFRTLGGGIVLAIVLVYLLMAANFQSWLEPFIITMAIPGALAGVLWMLVITGTTINVESLMGAIMAVGVGVANGNLLITFANELREEGKTPFESAIEAGRIRFRPIIMTALAMLLGMLPMALALGSGAEQNAPLGRAVIGGLLGATLMTLFVVPAVYSIFSRSLITKRERDQRVDSITLPGV